MTTHAAMSIPRQPFSPLTSPRLLHLQSSKNRQIGVLSSPLSSDINSKISAPAKSVSLNPPTKRRFSPSDADDELDTENMDPASFLTPSKRSKNNDSLPLKTASLSSSKFHLISTPTFSFTASKTGSTISMPPPSAIPARLQTPSSRKRTNVISPRAPLTAPAGRSPRSKRDLKNRRVSAPFTRIDPPSFSRGSSSAAALPFSLDAALAGTLAKPTTPTPVVKTIDESMPKGWFFDIYEETAEEEAANLMEHSTLVLDISSDEESTKLEREDKGKENVAPADYDLAPARRLDSSPQDAGFVAGRGGKQSITRRKVVAVDEMDDGERSPLSDLETEDFFAAGVTKDDFVVVPPTPEKKEDAAASEEVTEDCAEIRSASKTTSIPEVCVDKVSAEAPVVNSISDVKEDILIWEDGGDIAEAR